MSAFLEERVLSVHHWTDRLFSFTTTRDTSLRFSNGHFTMIGLKVDGKPLLRAYSIASANYEEHLEFLSIKVPDGPLTSRLQHIKVGDTITVDSFTGTVEQVGLKTTRLRSTTGEQIIISNGDLLKTRIRNLKRMRERRMLFTFGVVYEIAPELLARIPDMVREIVEAVPRTRFDRAHFKGFGASSLDFEVVYWMLTPDFNLSLDAQQDVNLALFRRFSEEGIAFAYPTQTLIVQGQTEQFPGGAPAAEAAG